MARLLGSEGVVALESVASYLGDTLPDDYVVVANPVVSNRDLDAVVLGPRGLFILQEVDRDTAAVSVVDGVLRADLPYRQKDLQASALQAIHAVEDFLHDEHSSMKPAIHHLHVVSDSESGMPVWRALEANGISVETLAEVVVSQRYALDPTLNEAGIREAVAYDLRDKRLTVSQKALHPFVFRGGAFLRVGKRVWTIRSAVDYMDRRPTVGIQALRDGTLANWLDDEGAPHLAELARNALAEAKSDDQMVLEIFLIGTGLVSRPAVRSVPCKADAGYILQGESRSLEVVLRRRQGYLFGDVNAATPWLHLETESVRGSPATVLASIVTRTLLIRPDAYDTAIRFREGASGDVFTIPIRLRVVASPSAQNRRLLRPLVVMLLCALLGAGFGWLLGSIGLPAPGLLDGWRFLGRQTGWIVLVGALWSLFGAVWGALLPPVWPLRYAARRLLLRLLAWIGILCVLIAAFSAYTWAAGSLTPRPGSLLLSAILSAGVWAIVPAILGEVVIARRTQRRERLMGRRRLGRILTLGLVAILVVAGVLFVVQTYDVAWQDASVQHVVDVTRTWLIGTWETINERADEMLDWLYLQYYDRQMSVEPTVAP